MEEKKDMGNTFIVDRDAIDYQKLAQALLAEAERMDKPIEEILPKEMFIKTAGKDGQWNENETIGIPLEDSQGRPNMAVLQGKDATSLGIKLPDEGYYVLVHMPKDNAIAKLYTKTKNAVGKVVETTKDLSSAAARKIMKGIEETSVAIAIMRESAKGAKKISEEKSKEAFDDAKKKYHQLGEDFDTKKDKLFDGITRDLINAQAKMYDKIAEWTYPFTRIKEAVKSAVKAGKESWQASKKATPSLKPRLTTVPEKEKETVNEMA